MQTAAEREAEIRERNLERQSNALLKLTMMAKQEIKIIAVCRPKKRCSGCATRGNRPEVQDAPGNTFYRRAGGGMEPERHRVLQEWNDSRRRRRVFVDNLLLSSLAAIADDPARYRFNAVLAGMGVRLHERLIPTANIASFMTTTARRWRFCFSSA